MLYTCQRESFSSWQKEISLIYKQFIQFSLFYLDKLLDHHIYLLMTKNFIKKIITRYSEEVQQQFQLINDPQNYVVQDQLAELFLYKMLLQQTQHQQYHQRGLDYRQLDHSSSFILKKLSEKYGIQAPKLIRVLGMYIQNLYKKDGETKLIFEQICACYPSKPKIKCPSQIISQNESSQNTSLFYHQGQNLKLQYFQQTIIQHELQLKDELVKITNIIGYLEDLKAAMRYDLKFPCKALSLSQFQWTATIQINFLRIKQVISVSQKYNTKESNKNKIKQNLSLRLLFKIFRRYSILWKIFRERKEKKHKQIEGDPLAKDEIQRRYSILKKEDKQSLQSIKQIEQKIQKRKQHFIYYMASQENKHIQELNEIQKQQGLKIDEKEIEGNHIFSLDYSDFQNKIYQFQEKYKFNASKQSISKQKNRQKLKMIYDKIQLITFKRLIHQLKGEDKFQQNRIYENYQDN